MPYYQDGNITLHSGDLRVVLPTFPENSVDCVVTDPPYGLCFMGKDWDQQVPGPEYWEAIKRVCKPGAHMVAFGGTRTWHRLACAIEDAGWEIRDTLMWLHSMGFPKSADVGKMIDKAKGAKREVVGTKMGLPGYTLSPNAGGASYNQGVSGHTADERIRTVEITAPATDLAKEWTGWTLALKPAWEPVILAMKPMDGTIAQNAEQWGVAGMNIDACRIGPCPGYKYNADRNGTTFHGKQGERIKQSAAKKGAATIEATKGRWPANVLLDEEAAAMLDEQSGYSKSSAKPRNNGDFKSPSKGAEKAHVTHGHEDEGGASRFFYVAKASKREKGADNDHPTVKPVGMMDYLLKLLSTPTGGVILDPFAGSGTTLVAAKRLGWTCIGVELTDHNCDIAIERLNRTEPE
jgi:site-specific DNA-methyltransferase (adenine-specific)